MTTQSSLNLLRQEICRLTQQYLERGGVIQTIGTTQSREAQLWEEGQETRRAAARHAAKAKKIKI